MSIRMLELSMQKTAWQQLLTKVKQQRSRAATKTAAGAVATRLYDDLSTTRWSCQASHASAGICACAKSDAV
jgi:hypothetical protein